MAGDIQSQLTQVSVSALAAGAGGRSVLAANPDYLEFRNEVNRLSSPSATEVTDWKKMEAMSLALAGLAADLMVYFHLCLAVVNTRGYPVLVTALASFNHLLENGWNICTPAKQRGEYFKTFSRRLALEMKTRGPDRDVKVLKECEEQLVRMNQLLNQNGAAALAEAMEVLLGHIQQLTPAAAVVAPTPAPVAPPPPELVGETPPEPVREVRAEPARPAPTPAPVARPAEERYEPAASSSEAPSDGKTRSVLERELAVLAERVAAVQRQEDLTSATPYRLLRAVLWSGAKEPVGDKQDKTRLPPPQPHQLKKVGTALPEGASKDVIREIIRETEEMLRSFPLWLDLQPRVVSALESLGAQEAADAICRELVGLVSRAPGLLKLKFSSGTGFASDETVQWYQQVALRRSGGASQAPAPVYMPAPVVAPATPLAAAASPAAPARVAPPPLVPVSIAYAAVEIPRGTVAIGDNDPLPEGLGPALVALHQREMRSASPRRRFELRIQMVDCCLAHSRVDLAGPLVDGLEKALEQHRLEQWDPELAVLVLRQKLVVERTRPMGEEGRIKRLELWARICQLSPAEAVALGSET